jgi:polar amino acid transport system substrate-binding protein
MLRRTVIAVSMAVAAMLATASAKAQTVDEIVKRGEIVIGIDLTNPPWGFLDEKQEPTGFDPNYAKLVADKLGVKLKIERVNSPGRIPFLQSGRIDMVLSTLSITSDRAKQVWFTAPYAPNPLILIAPKSTPFNSMAELKGKRIAVPRGSPQDITVTRDAVGAEILRFEDDASVQQALLTGQADFIGGGLLTPAALNKMSPGKDYESKFTLNALYMGMAVKKGNSDLLQFLNTIVFLTKQSGEIDALTRKYLNVPVGDLPVF